MTLPADYMQYGKRGRGQDHDRYAFALARTRAPKRLANCAKLAVSIVVPLEFFMLNPSGKPFRHPGAMQTPYPDLRHYTTRDYGNRVGAFRLLKIFRETGVTATFAVNAVLFDRARPLIDAIVKDGHEIAAHGWDTDSIHWGGIGPAAEEAYVARTRAAFAAAGLSARIWMSPARQQSFATLDLIAGAGFDICLDWEVDTVPVAAATRAGPVTLFPLLNELDDRSILAEKRHSEDQWRAQILEAADMMLGEYESRGAQCFALTMTPYIAGLPFRIRAARQIVEGLKARALLAPIGEIVQSFRA